MFWKDNKRKGLMRRAQELEERSFLRPYEPCEVDAELAEHMGAFREDAVEPDDFYELEKGVIDGLLGGRAEPGDYCGLGKGAIDGLLGGAP
ncbi:MAG: hypothetical protein LBU69_06260, partial [Deltaproteobacteria bacterium]|nr:hypothetical protein [Deltaproteobacteria bacterium]